MMETKGVYAPMEHWNADETRYWHEAQWLSEGGRRAHIVAVPGKPMYHITLERTIGRLGGER